MQGNRFRCFPEAASRAARVANASPDTRANRNIVVSSLDTRSIFRQLLLNEVREGRFTPARRRRIIAYAAQLGLSAVEMGELMAFCRQELLESTDEHERVEALRLVMPDPRAWPTAWKMILIAAGAIALELLYLNSRW